MREAGVLWSLSGSKKAALAKTRKHRHAATKRVRHKCDAGSEMLSGGGELAHQYDQMWDPGSIVPPIAEDRSSAMCVTLRRRATSSALSR